MQIILLILRDWFSTMFAERDEFGLSDEQRATLLSLAGEGEEGRDTAERIACGGYGLKTSQFFELLAQNGISSR
ncbi:hypothetical protein [Ralstonia pseudosolanacearum]|uniref:hypothetical protein n=1 Tax=Ralstonia pseudosolanacearum TaxID=1310165 RepID=UPI003CE82D20